MKPYRLNAQAAIDAYDEAGPGQTLVKLDDLLRRVSPHITDLSTLVAIDNARNDLSRWLPTEEKT